MATSTPKSDKPAADKPAADSSVPPVLVDSAEAHTDRVAMVSRDKNGNPDQSADYEVIVPDDEKDVAENLPADNQVDEG